MIRKIAHRVFRAPTPLVRKARTLVRQLTTDPLHAYRLVVHADRFIAYSASPALVAPPPPGEGTTCVKLSDAELSQLPPAFDRQAERLRRFGYNDAYGVLHRGQIVHVAWLVPWEHDRLAAATRFVKLRRGEAEITHCLTAPEFRGRGLYSFAIRSLCQIAGQNGINKVFMVTLAHNKSSQRGIEKAGFVRCGSIMCLRLSTMRPFSGLVFRTHRWRRLER